VSILKLGAGYLKLETGNWLLDADYSFETGNWKLVEDPALRRRNWGFKPSNDASNLDVTL